VKVGDFGLVTAITRPSRGKSKRHEFFQDENHTGQVGTQLYMSPEQASGKPYSQKVDLYALGLILFELLNFFSTQMERMRLIYGLKSGQLPDSLQGKPEGSLVKLLTDENPSNRPEAKELKSHSLLLEFEESIKKCENEDEEVEDEDDEKKKILEIDNKNEKCDDGGNRDAKTLGEGENASDFYWCN